MKNVRSAALLILCTLGSVQSIGLKHLGLTFRKDIHGGVEPHSPLGPLLNRLRDLHDTMETTDSSGQMKHQIPKNLNNASAHANAVKLGATRAASTKTNVTGRVTNTVATKDFEVVAEKAKVVTAASAKEVEDTIANAGIKVAAEKAKVVTAVSSEDVDDATAKTDSKVAAEKATDVTAASVEALDDATTITDIEKAMDADEELDDTHDFTEDLGERSFELNSILNDAFGHPFGHGDAEDLDLSDYDYESAVGYHDSVVDFSARDDNGRDADDDDEEEDEDEDHDEEDDDEDEDEDDYRADL